MRKFNILIFLIILFVVPSFCVKAASVDYDDCIKDFGSITFVSAGPDNAMGSRVVYSNKKNNLDWNPNPVSYDVEVKARSFHKVKSITYVIDSKEGYSCKGKITGSLIENNAGSVKLHVEINKGYVSEMYFSGRSVNRNDPNKGEMIRSNLIRVHKEMTAAELEALDKENDITTGEKLTCDTLDDLIKKYWSWVVILLPLLTMVLITIDFVTSLVSNDADSIKKSSLKAFKRAIALVLLLLLPIILNLLFRIFGIETCF